MDGGMSGCMGGWRRKRVCTLKGVTEHCHLKSLEVILKGKRTKEKPEATYGISKAEREAGHTVRREELLRRLSN